MTPDERNMWDRLIATSHLKEPDQFELERMRINLSDDRVSQVGLIQALMDHHIGTGRTTRMKVRTLAWLASDETRPAMVVGHTKQIAVMIIQDIRWMATLIDMKIDKGMLVGTSYTLLDRAHGSEMLAFRKFYDHYCGGES